ncbi:MAG TPA: CoA transferase [Gaiellaceae bacterium]|nr:CoA transferase [Gaiellaceae bacterium]
MTAPLADVRVVAIEQFGAGPWATMQLADLGAEVIKLEDPTTGVDVGRYVPPFQEGEDGLWFESFNRNKRSVSLDLRRPDARAVLEDLVRGSDALYSNLRGDLPARLRIRYDDLRHANPQIVCCSLSGFGQTGPRAAQPAYDNLMQGLAGWMAITGEPDGPPTRSGLSLVDLSGGYVSALALLAGVHRARRDGVGCDCDVSLFETALAELMYVGTWAASRGHVAPRRPWSAHPSVVPFQNLPTADGWIAVACAKEKFWVALCAAIGRPELAAAHPDFAARDERRDEVVAALAEAFAARTTAEWVALLVPAGVPCAPVNSVEQALADPQVEARDGLIEYEHPALGTVRQPASPLRIEGEPAPVARAPHRGEHTDEVLREVCGYDESRIAELRSGGALG